MKIGGYAHSNGITFFCDVLKIQTIKVKEEIKYEIAWILPPKWLRKLEGKFLFTSFLVVYYQWRIMSRKYKGLLIGFLLLTILEEIFKIPVLDKLPYLSINKWRIYGVLILCLLWHLKKIIRLFQYHGAEHKVINCYIKYGYVNHYLVKNSSRFNKRCGSNLVLIMIILYGVLWIFSIESLIAFFLLFLVSIQILKKVVSKNRRWDKYMNLLQWLTVLEPKEEDIDLAIYGFKALQQAYHVYCREASA
ncbi:DUF1385 domain-containing protein [Clostridium formicaceticum]|uniref:DUF1385 domain-containing protein n=1 Tax=Clostridium formicaceticum TaxID=1497 RepID=A0AAC9WFA0_9CLOT|nr:DUF1385 domain-containing protein [Clostridium formicaceticum]AOY76179.1 hypothetical protein BJL90_09855 [Clostridium formicaceticum]ARE86551.1 hypothetical protein CLFO_08750 [Clostridium formicaceticum]